MKESILKGVICASLITLLSPLSDSAWAANTTHTDLSGTIKSSDGADICAMVLASGQFMFSCNPNGVFSLPNLPRETNGTVKRQIYADGFFPKIDILTGSSNDAVVMTESGTCPSYNTPYDPAYVPDSAGKRIYINGMVLAQDSQTPICAMVLANGQHTFSCDGTGYYVLNIPLDTNGQFKLQVYADGYAPTIQRLNEFKALNNDVRMARSSECQVTPPKLSPPSAPSGLTATAVSETEVQLSWTDNSNNENGFRIYQAEGSCGAAFEILETISAGSTSASIIDLVPGDTTCYKVTAFNFVGESGYSNSSSATTTSSPATLRIVNDLYKLDSGENFWSQWNQIVYVRIGPYIEVLGAECNSVLNSTAYERLNPGTTAFSSNPGPTIHPGYTDTPSTLTYEDFDVSNFTSGKYCVYLQAGWWEPELNWYSDHVYYNILKTDVYSCDGQMGYDNKWNGFAMDGHTTGLHTEYVSNWLPHFQWQGSSFCQ